LGGAARQSLVERGITMEAMLAGHRKVYRESLEKAVKG
jgi:hypothetical protein